MYYVTCFVTKKCDRMTVGLFFSFEKMEVGRGACGSDAELQTMILWMWSVLDA
jgi:hypothetical protein